jgi:hypothetical protein
MWNPTAATSVRIAITRTVRRTLVTDQTLEPTQVAGFNQFFDGLDVTKAWRYGAAIDHKFTKTLFGGVEFSTRRLEIPLIDASASPASIQDLDGKEYLGRTYLFWTPHPWIAVRTEYSYERFTNDQDLGEPTLIKTHRLPVGLRLFHPSGFSGFFTATYHRQSGNFFSSDTSGRDAFWTIDTAINYRLPNRTGFVTLGATNLFDSRFKYFEVDRDNPRLQPKRMAFIRLTLSLP